MDDKSYLPELYDLFAAVSEKVETKPDESLSIRLEEDRKRFNRVLHRAAMCGEKSEEGPFGSQPAACCLHCQTVCRPWHAFP